VQTAAQNVLLISLNFPVLSSQKSFSTYPNTVLRNLFSLTAHLTTSQNFAAHLDH